jgi:hypothetical protein
VVGVAVGEHEGPYVGQGAPDPGQLLLEQSAVAGEAGVDDGDAVLGHDEVAVDEGAAGAGADPVEPGGDLHGVCSCSGEMTKAMVDSLEG